MKHIYMYIRTQEKQKNIFIKQKKNVSLPTDIMQKDII